MGAVYQFVHHLAPSDLNDYDDLISASGRLNQYQRDIIASEPTGLCLFTIGSNQRTIINIKTNPIEIKAIGNNREKGELGAQK
ncbi:hypothetical protein [Spiroplasma endosymbiont of Megaselia nigra]|uniref:hypothetical protein n=1 Tax=Spiroplasma endosymbiont of Megaselia nigra TaxID=2478537 RepID=UPI000F87E99B|nr:hypothetical protein [Spiroplasma endosymbiont of Megaselia nigra]RUO86152.1 hypothetical protein D9R21_04775 [Spiroplasma endosymbiont of Megaselia nigra]